jgi:5-methylcytosine-specific restriction endonuclease McrA
MNTDAPASAYSLDHVANDELHLSTRRLVGRSNQLLAALLAHLGEVEARGIHRERSCASLYTYCVYELRLSEDAAFRRARAAKIAREFPVVLEQIAAGEIHLTGLLLLGPHLTEQNHQELLALARHRTKRDLLRLIRRIDPQPDAPASVEPLGPTPVGVPVPTANPSWEEFVEALSPPVRELGPGDNPREWLTEAAPDDDSDLGVAEPPDGASLPEDTRASASATPVAPPQQSAPERYKVQFTATQEYVDLLQQAKDLASHALPSGGIEQLHLQAMRLLVAELKKRRCATVNKPRTGTSAPRQRVTGEADASGRRDSGEAEATRQRGSVPAAVRRTVWSRDSRQCTYVDHRGIRCRETALLELHHLDPHARGGLSSAANLTLRCKAHNALAAEHDFGRDFMQAKRAEQVARARGPG